MTVPICNGVAPAGPSVRQMPDKKASRRRGTRRALKNMTRWLRTGRRAAFGADGLLTPTPTPPGAQIPGEHGLQYPEHGGGLYPEAGERRDYYPDE